MIRKVTSVREVNGIDGRVLSSEIFALTPRGDLLPNSPISDYRMEQLIAHGYQPSGNWGGS